MDYEKLKEVIAKQIKENGKREITGPVLQAVLMAMVDSLGEVYPHTYTDEEKAQARANIDALSNHNGEITKEKLSLEVQAILNDVANKQNISDATLATIAKTIVGAINEVYKGGLEDASIATSKIEDGAITEPKLDTDLINVITSAVQPAGLASAIATALASYVAKADIVATTGSATDKVMSQHGATEAIDGVTNKVTELERELLDQDENYVSGYRLLSGYDDQVADAEWMYTKDYVPAKKGDVVIWNPNLIKSGASIQYYDENKNYLFYATANALTRTITIGTEGTAYIRASFSLASKQDAKLIVNDVVVWTPKERNNGKIGQLNDLVNKLEQDVVDVKNEHSDATLFATHGLVFPNCFDITPIYGKYKEGRLINGVINQTVSSTMSYDGYIPIVKGKLITIMALKIGSLQLNTLSFFDENKVFISEQHNVRPAIADIPSNAKYIKFTISKNQYNTYLVQGDGIVICYVDSDIAIEPEMLVSKIPLPNVSIPYIDDYVNENNNRLNKTFALIGSEIPDYWNEEVQDAINKVENTMEDISSHGDAFIFLTDMHYPSNYGMSTKLAKYIARHSSVSKIVFGGDIMNTATTKVEAASYLRRIKNEFNGFDFSGIVGNHDANSNAVSDTSLHLGDDCLYSNFIYPNNDKLVSNGELYYYRDNNNAKIRFLYLNTGKASQVISASQLEWMVSRIAELNSDWSVVIIAHEIWDAWNDGNPTLHPSGQNIIGTINDQYNLFKCNILAIVSGHTHFDYSVKDSHGYWIICSTCDANGANARVDPVNPTRTQGTTSEQAFDIFLFDATSRKIKAVRVGAGEDRTFE